MSTFSFNYSARAPCSGWKLHLHITDVLHIIIGVWLRVPAMLPSSNTQLFQKTVMVRDIDLFLSQLRLRLKLQQSFMPSLLVKGNGPTWASNLNSAEYEVICPGKGPVPITDYASCHLAKVPAHAVVTRPESHSNVVRILQDQQVSGDFFRPLLIFVCLHYKILHYIDWD